MTNENHAEIKKIQNKEDPGWCSVEDSPPLDYWFAVGKYKGDFSGRIRFNMHTIEQICRENNLPPIVLTTEDWTPDGDADRNWIAPGLAAFKKVGFGERKTSGNTRLKSALAEIVPTKQTLSDEGIGPVPLGWEIRVRSRKILFDYNQKHPNATPQ